MPREFAESVHATAAHSRLAKTFPGGEATANDRDRRETSAAVSARGRRHGSGILKCCRGAESEG